MIVNLTKEQNEFIEKALAGNNILVDACIGSGKTTTIQYFCNKLDASKKVLYLTYNRLLKNDAREKIHQSNVMVTNYHGFACHILKTQCIKCSVNDAITIFNKSTISIPLYDVLVIDEYQDIESEFADMLKTIVVSNPNIQILVVGDMHQKIYDKSYLNITKFIDELMGTYIKMEFTNCFRLNKEFANELGNIWNKTIIGCNSEMKIKIMELNEVANYISNLETKDILCLGKRNGKITTVLNEIENKFPKKFNKTSVYASIRENESSFFGEIQENSAIFTTYDSAKGLERKYCFVFDFNEEYWNTRSKIEFQKYEILRNIFCVAVSRGSQEVIFVKNSPIDSILSKETIKTPFLTNYGNSNFDISTMFDFKYQESIKECYDLLEIDEIDNGSKDAINIKKKDNNIDLSPCIGIFQECSFFNLYHIDDEIIITSKMQNSSINENSLNDQSMEEKVLLLASIETKQDRYKKQVDIPFISNDEKVQLDSRLNTVFSKDEKVQIPCSFVFKKNSRIVIGRSDVVKNDKVYELKFVDNLEYKHFLQCACYMYGLNMDEGILWNTYNNSMFQIRINNRDKFISKVEDTVFKHGPDDTNNYFALIDTETNYDNQTMSVGLVIINKYDYSIKESNYYVLTPEYKRGGMFAETLFSNNTSANCIMTRQDAIIDIKLKLFKYDINELFAYNAPFDYQQMPELNYLKWYDIVNVAAYKQHNSFISDNMELCKTGRLKKGYGVEDIIRIIYGSNKYMEKHNALSDAIDELSIIKGLNLGFNYLLKYCLYQNEHGSSNYQEIDRNLLKKIVDDRQKEVLINKQIQNLNIRKKRNNISNRGYTELLIFGVVMLLLVMIALFIHNN